MSAALDRISDAAMRMSNRAQAMLGFYMMMEKRENVSLNTVMRTKCSTSIVLEYNPSRVMLLSDTMLCAVVYMECLRVALNHCNNRVKTPMDIYKISSDIIVADFAKTVISREEGNNAEIIDQLFPTYWKYKDIFDQYEFSYDKDFYLEKVFNILVENQDDVRNEGKGDSQADENDKPDGNSDKSDDDNGEGNGQSDDETSDSNEASDAGESDGDEDDVDEDETGDRNDTSDDTGSDTEETGDGDGEEQSGSVDDDCDKKSSEENDGRDTNETSEQDGESSDSDGSRGDRTTDSEGTDGEQSGDDSSDETGDAENDSGEPSESSADDDGNAGDSEANSGNPQNSNSNQAPTNDREVMQEYFDNFQPVQDWNGDPNVENNIENTAREAKFCGMYDNMSKAVGNRIMEANGISRVNCRDLFSRWLGCVQDDTYRDTRMKRNRRYGLREPGHIHNTRPKLLLAADVSGSMTMYTEACIEFIHSVSQECDIDVAFWDVTCSEPSKSTRCTNKYAFSGGGGTNPECVMEKLMDIRANYTGIIYLTDCYFEWPKPLYDRKVYIIRTDVGGEFPAWTENHSILGDLMKSMKR